MTIQIGINQAAKNRQLANKINIERDRRVLENFVFQGKSYDCDRASQSNISGAATLAGFALGQGAASGNYRWNGADVDFSWLASDNTSTLMDAPTMFAMGQALAEHVRAHIFASRVVKDMASIPLDFADDSHWPAAN